MTENYMQKAMAGKPPVVLFDGLCPLCHGSVNFLLKVDQKGLLKFASLQSDYGRTMVTAHGKNPEILDTIYFLEGRGLSEKSTAFIRISRYLGGVWPLCMIAILIPRFMRDYCYDLVSRSRYQQFGRYDTCPLPNPKFEDRFYQ
ncbi:MAG: DCC1-like thiol-disulfide oxidoreductase family protein [Nitrospinota bacterium]|nr:DCC1-like thiol-disulfide oxidoreductase family protein [Nitrospinota bacterium]